MYMKIYKFFVTLAIVLLFSLCQAQEISKTFGHPNNNTCNALLATEDGGYVMLGTYDVDNLFSGEMNLLKIDSSGTLEWSYTYGEKKDKRGKKKDGAGNSGNDLITTYDNGFLLVGESHGFGSGNSDVYVVNVNSSGDTLWSSAYGGSRDDYGYAVVKGYDSNYLVAGYTESFGAGIRDGYLLMLDEIGDTLWTLTVGGSSIDGLFDVVRTTDSCFLGLGYTLEKGNSDIFLVKVDRNGTPLWTRSYGGNKHDFGYDLKQTADSGYIIVGNSESFGEGLQDVYVLKIDKYGDLEWSNTYGGDGYESANSVDLTKDGFIIAGHTRSFGAGWEDVYICRINTSGNIIWSSTYGDIDRDIGRVVKTTETGFIIASNTLSFGFGNDDIYVFTIDSLGDNSCFKTTADTKTNKVQSESDSIKLSFISGAITTQVTSVVGKTILARKYPCKDLNSDVATKRNESFGFAISPNPITSNATIEIRGLIDTCAIDIIDVLGVTIKEYRGYSNHVDLSLGDLSTGVYYVVICSGNECSTQKIIKR